MYQVLEKLVVFYVVEEERVSKLIHQSASK